MSIKLKTQECRACGGTGVVPDEDVGPILKKERERLGIRVVDLLPYLNISDTYLYDLERGNRRWTNELLVAYQKGLKELSNGGGPTT